jgi:hypothetical protein
VMTIGDARHRGFLGNTRYCIVQWVQDEVSDHPIFFASVVSSPVTLCKILSAW